MRIAAVIDTDGQTVKPLLGGTVIRIRDTKSGEEVEVPNPAISATQHRRIAVLQEILRQNVEVVVNPPETFCAHSYKAAQHNQLRFWDVSAQTTWDELWQDGSNPESQTFSTEIPEERLASHHGHHHH